MHNLMQHLAELKPFLAMEIFAQAQRLEAQGKKIIHLEFGEPNFATPPVVLQAAIQALQEEQTKYTHTQGLQEFCQAVVDKYQRMHGIQLEPSRVLTSSGSSILLYMAIKLLVPAGDEILITDPCYSCYNNLPLLAGAKAVRVPLYREEGYQLDLARLKKAVTKKTKAILVNSPMNPTGTAFNAESLRSLAELDIPIISDEIYADLVYEGTCPSILSFTDRAMVINGLSKYYAMTGWRLGYMILPEAWMGTAAKMHQNMMISAAHFVQKAGAVALTQAEGDCLKMKEEFAARRLLLLEQLSQVGLEPGYNPTGAFYVLMPYPDPEQKGSLATALEILEKTGVALTPGIDFGPRGEGHLRLSYAAGRPELAEAVQRLGRFFQKV